MKDFEGSSMTAVYDEVDKGKISFGEDQLCDIILKKLSVGDENRKTSYVIDCLYNNRERAIRCSSTHAMLLSPWRSVIREKLAQCFNSRRSRGRGFTRDG